MAKIEKTARGDKFAEMLNASNLSAPIKSMKRIEVRTPPASDAKLKQPKGYEVWLVEAETGSYDVRVEIPAKVHNIKDAAKRTEAVKALVAEAAAGLINSDLAAHAG